MIEKKSPGDMIFVSINYILVTLVAIACLYPMVHVFMGSLSNPLQLIVHTGPLIRPLGFTTDGYNIVLRNPNIWIGYRNTIYYVVVGTFVNILFTTLGAYALSRANFMFKRTITIGIIFTMYFSGGMIPNFLLVQALGMLDTRAALIIPGAITTWNLIVMRTSFQHIPASLEESAKIDGANDFIILFRIFVPVAKATIAVMILFYAVAHWNSWFPALLFIRTRDLLPLQMFLREILIAHAVGGNIAIDADMERMHLEQVIRYSTIIVTTVPILFAYPFAQKYFMSGVMLGSLKE